MSLLLAGISCSSEPGGESGTVIPPGTVVDSCPPGYTCDTNDNGDIVVVGGGGGTGGATGATGGATGIGGTTGATGGTTGATGGTTNTGGTTSEETCTDELLPDNPEPCQNWKDWGHCEESWLQGYCNATCGRCTPSGTGGGTGSGGGDGTGGWGNDVTLPDINGGSTAWASRYWDCCRHHCTWSGNGGNVPACGQNGVSQTDSGSACGNPPGDGYTCYNQAPRAVSDTVSYGYVARSNPQCGLCYHIQFTGASENAPGDPGSAAIAGKHMIVQVSNTGGDVAGNQMDLMIPGGGVGINPKACEAQWGLSAGELGPTHGGFLSDCGGDHNARKQCVRDKCDKLPAGDLRDGCYWFVDWFQAADNPQFRYTEVPCPSDF